jgi:hypothetical protein
VNRSRTYDRRYQPSWQRQAQYFVGSEVVTAVPCAYCGEHSEHEEHLVPYSFIRRHNSANNQQEGWWTWILPSCSECNYIASNQVFVSVQLKRSYIRERLRAKYSDAFVEGEWTDEEIDDLGPGLRQFVMASQARNAIARDRVSYSGPLPTSLGSVVLHDAVRAYFQRQSMRGE